MNMPRVARKISNTKVYHIILRGNDRQDIFYDEQDYKKFLKTMKMTKEKYQYKIYAYCLMTNHVHLVIYDKNNQISKIMQSIAISYSSYFSKKYDKEGHLFQNRFLSKNVETKEYMCRLCRYIHQNPVKSRISTIEQYKWSSYLEFIYGEKIINREWILPMFGQTQKEAIENFIIFHSYEKKTINEEVEYEIIDKLTDEQAKKKIQEVLNIKDVREIRTYNKKVRDEKIYQLKNIRGTSKAQLSRILGVNRKVIERVMKIKNSKK